MGSSAPSSLSSSAPRPRPYLLTGSTSTIGFAIAKELASTDNVLLFLADSDFDRVLLAVSRILTVGFASTVLPLHLDVASDRSILEAVKSVTSEFSARQMPLALAGIIHASSSLPSIRHGGPPLGDPVALREQLQTTFGVNVFGAACVTEAFLPYVNAFMASRPSILYAMGFAAARAGNSLPLAINCAHAAISALVSHYAHALPGARVVAVDIGFAFKDEADAAHGFVGHMLAEQVLRGQTPSGSVIDLTGEPSALV